MDEIVDGEGLGGFILSKIKKRKKRAMERERERASLLHEVLKDYCNVYVHVRLPPLYRNKMHYFQFA